MVVARDLSRPKTGFPVVIFLSLHTKKTLTKNFSSPGVSDEEDDRVREPLQSNSRLCLLLNHVDVFPSTSQRKL